jgi:hypothetical protein
MTSMTQFDAVGIAEGFVEARDEEHVIEAWQYLHDTGLAYRLQGWFGRQARALIEQGVIVDKSAVAA